MMDKEFYPMLSQNLEDWTIPGVGVEVDPDVAEELGAFEESALTEEDAIESGIEMEGV